MSIVHGLRVCTAKGRDDFLTQETEKQTLLCEKCFFDRKREKTMKEKKKS